MGRKEKEAWWLGSDCGQEEHHFVLLDSAGEIRLSRRVAYRRTEVDSLLMEALEKAGGHPVRMAVEGTRSMGMALVLWAENLGVEIWQAPGLALNRYREVEGQPVKTDERDAYLLARMGLVKAKRCRPAMKATDPELNLYRLGRFRERLVHERTRAYNQLRAILVEVCPDYLSTPGMCQPTSATTLAVLSRWPGLEGLERAKVPSITECVRKASRGRFGEALARLLRRVAATIAWPKSLRFIATFEMTHCVEIIRRINELVAHIEQLMAQEVNTHPRGAAFLSVPGHGLVTTATLLGEWGPLARVAREAGCATYGGVTPTSRQSGKGRDRARRSGNVNKRVLNALYKGALASLRVSEIDQAYFQRKRLDYAGHPSPHIAALLALARQRHKLLYRLFHSGELYDPERVKQSTRERREHIPSLGATPVGRRPPSVAPKAPL